MTLVFSLSVFVSCNLVSAQAAGTLHKDLPNGAPKQGIVVDDISKFYKIKPVFSSTNPKIKMFGGRPWGNNQFVNNPAEGYHVRYDGTLAGGTTLNDSFTLKWTGIGVDLDGSPVDIVLRASNFRITGQTTNPTFITLYSSGCLFADATSNLTAGNKSFFDIEYFFYKSGTASPANGSMTLQFTDLDAWGENDWQETVRLLANYEPDLHVIPDNMLLDNSGDPSRPGCWLDIKYVGDGKDNTLPTFSASRGKSDNNTLHTGFCVSARNGFKFSWWGYGCATWINSFYGQKIITATHGAGGTITSPGKSTVAWKHDKEYVVTSEKYYQISSIVVDGKPVEIKGERDTGRYIFSSVVKDHAIHVEFERIHCTLAYNKNAPDVEGDIPPEALHEAGTEAIIETCGATRSGYSFKGWNTEPDGSGRCLSPEDTFLIEENTTLYAQWEPILHTVSWIDGITSEIFSSEEVADGGDALLPAFPKHLGYKAISPVSDDERELKHIVENKVFEVLYERESYTATVRYLHVQSGREISERREIESEYEADESVNTFVDSVYRYIPERVIIKDANTGEIIDDVFLDFDGDGEEGHVTWRTPARNIIIDLLYDTWIDMPETGSYGFMFISMAGALIEISMIMIMVRANKHKR